MKPSILKALQELDGLGDKAVRVRILGLKAGPEEAEDGMEEAKSEENEVAEEGYHPKAETAEKAVAETLGEERNEPEADKELVDPELLAKLKALLSK